MLPRLALTLLWQNLLCSFLKLVEVVMSRWRTFVTAKSFCHQSQWMIQRLSLLLRNGLLS